MFKLATFYGREEIFAEFNFADEPFSDKNFAHFDPPRPHFDPLFSEKEKKSNFAEFNFADRAKIHENFFP